jgi:hypothetical protein
MAWLMYDLCMHQDVQQKVRDEVAATINGQYKRLQLAVCTANCMTTLTAPTCTLLAHYCWRAMPANVLQILTVSMKPKNEIHPE